MLFKKKKAIEEKKGWREEFREMIQKRIDELDYGYCVTVKLPDGAELTFRRDQKKDNLYY